MVRYRELDRILPALSEMGVFAMVVTSAVIPIPAHWMEIPARASPYQWTVCPNTMTFDASRLPTSAS
jgi:hypothetical protein